MPLTLFALFVLFVCWDWSLNSGLCTCKADALLLECSNPFCSGYFGDGLKNYLPRGLVE
jgi:hypothetical protein